LNTALQRLIPSDCFEWKAGIRKLLIFIVPIWLIGLCYSFFVGSVPLVLFILGILPSGFYSTGESLPMLLVFEMKASKLVVYKIKMQIILFSIISAPIILSFLVFHSDLWYLPLIEYILLISLHIYIILAKYAFYQPNQKTPTANVFNSIGAMAILIPFLIPVIWILSIWFYLKSIENLNLYLNDYN
jgi:hypothetical protein